jgi:hypothetical protein
VPGGRESRCGRRCHERGTCVGAADRPVRGRRGGNPRRRGVGARSPSGRLRGVPRPALGGRPGAGRGGGFAGRGRLVGAGTAAGGTCPGAAASTPRTN